MRDQSVSACEVDDAATSKPAPGTPRDLPGLVELLPGNALDRAEHAPHAIEQRLAREATEVARGEERAAPVIERGQRAAYTDDVAGAQSRTTLPLLPERMTSKASWYSSMP